MAYRKIQFFLIALLLYSVTHAQTEIVTPPQKVKLSEIGDLSCGLTYGELVKAIGEPDSLHGYPMPYGKELPRYDLYYGEKELKVRLFGTFTKKTTISYIDLYPKSTIKLNDVLPADMDSASIVRQYGLPESISIKKNELVMDYRFERGKHFTLVDFYFNEDRTIKKIWIIFGRY